MNYAPVMIPTLCRYDKLKRCLESLRKNSWAQYTEVYISVDYPAKENHWDGYNKICAYLEGDFPEFKATHIVKRDHNYGAGQNSQALREELLRAHDRFIYTDDDIEFSPNFLEYIDKTMELYEDDPNVIAVCGYSYPLPWNVSSQSNTFKTTMGCHMWGTGFWRDKYLPLQQALRNGALREEYATGNQKFWREKLIDARYIEFLGIGISTQKGLLDSASDVGISTYMELYDKYAILPVVSKSRNHGFDGTGMYCQNIKKFSFNASNYDYSNQKIDCADSFDLHPDIAEREVENRKLWENFDCRKKKQVLKAEFKRAVWKVLGASRYDKLLHLIHIVKNNKSV